MTYEDILRELVEHDNRFMVLTAENRAAIRNLPDQIGDRFIDTGITEQTEVQPIATTTTQIIVLEDGEFRTQVPFE